MPSGVSFQLASIQLSFQLASIQQSFQLASIQLSFQLASIQQSFQLASIQLFKLLERQTLNLGVAHFGLVCHWFALHSDQLLGNANQCTEVLEFELHASCQCLDGLENEGRSNYLHQSQRIATQIYTRVESANWRVLRVVKNITSATFTPWGIVLGRVTRSKLTYSDSLAISQLHPDSRTQLGKPVAHLGEKH